MGLCMRPRPQGQGLGFKSTKSDLKVNVVGSPDALGQPDEARTI